MIRTARALLSGALLYVPAAIGADSSVSMEIRIAILPVMMLNVSSEWITDDSARAASGARIVRATGRYGVTSTVDGASIAATLLDPLPPGVTVVLTMESTAGVSAGWKELRSGERVTLVRDVKGAELNVIRVEMRMPASATVSEVRPAIVFEID